MIWTSYLSTNDTISWHFHMISKTMCSVTTVPGTTPTALPTGKDITVELN